MTSATEENTVEYKNLVDEIDHLKQQIQTTKDNIYRYYTLKRKTEALANNSDNENPVSQTSKQNINLELLFYNQIMQLKSKEDESLITVLFPFNGESNFGLNLIKTDHGKWSLEKCSLPHSVDYNHFKKEIRQLSLQETSEFVEQLQQNVYAFYVRADFVKQLKLLIEWTEILLYHSLHYTELELTFKVFNKKTKIRRSLTIQLKYHLLFVLPDEVICNVNGQEEDEDMKNFFEDHFEIFKEIDLVTGFKEAFRNVDDYIFFG